VAADPRFYRVHSFRCRSYLADDLGTPDAMGAGMGKSQKDEDNAKRVMLKAFKELEIYDDPVTQKIYEDNKIFIRQCLSEQAGVNEYKRIMEYFEDYADYRTIGTGTDFKTFQGWKQNKRTFNSQETYDEYLQKNKITRNT
jgi:microsomal dipeptidase-like Zn-dependent dipeptidase